MKRATLKYPIPRLTPIKTLADIALAGSDMRDWYVWANEEIGVASGRLGITPDRFAQLLALFSPRVSVLRSIKWALHYVAENDYLHDCPVSVKQAVTHWEGTGKIRGVKTYPFYRALMGDRYAIVLDTHMGNAMGCDSKRFEVKTVHRACSDRLWAVANLLDWRPAETQAAIWAGHLRSIDQAVPRLSILPIMAEEEIPV